MHLELAHLESTCKYSKLSVQWELQWVLLKYKLCFNILTYLHWGNSTGCNELLFITIMVSSLLKSKATVLDTHEILEPEERKKKKSLKNFS